jgi:peptidoglycan/LPS O-acetylase OafA/YrhL
MGLWSDWSAETSFKTTGKGGFSSWFWIVVGAAAVLVLGTVAYLVVRKRFTKRLQRSSNKRVKWWEDWDWEE